MTDIATARTSHVLSSTLDLCGAARAAGWRSAEVVRPDEMLCGAAQLQLAAQTIPVRVVINTGGDIAPLLERLRHDVLHTFALEQVIVMVDFTQDAVRHYHASFQKVTTRRVTVRSPQGFHTWLRARLGPIGAMPLESPLRLLAEHLLCVSAGREPREKCKLVGNFTRSQIAKQFHIGALGVQAIGTLFGYTRGKDGVENVESDAKYQLEDVDLLVKASGLRNEKLKVEVKNEVQTRGNIAMELLSSFEHNTQGWFEYSKAQILCSILWPSNDVFLMDLDKLREWVKPNCYRFPVVPCGVPEQSYTSRCRLIKASEMLAEFPDSIHLDLGEWLPGLYADNASIRSQVKAYAKAKTLHPQRLDWPV